MTNRTMEEWNNGNSNGKHKISTEIYIISKNCIIVEAGYIGDDGYQGSSAESGNPVVFCRRGNDN